MSDYIIKLLCFIDPFRCIGDHTIKHVLGTSSIVISFTTVDGSFVVDACIWDNAGHERGNQLILQRPEELGVCRSYEKPQP